MCTLCANFQPWQTECVYDTSTPATGGSTGSGDNSLPVYTMDQIAFQLTNGYWGGNTYKFNTTTSSTLTVDLSGLTTGGQDMARQALQAWSDVSGLVFSETAVSQGSATGVVTEGPDASSGILTAYSMTVGQNFLGSLSTGADRDAVAVTLTAGQKVTVALKGDASNGTAVADPLLRLRDSAGNIIRQNDDMNGADSFISFQAPTSGTYFIQAGSANDAGFGGYRIELRNGLGNAQITLDDNASGAYASFQSSGGYLSKSTINIAANWAGGSARTDGYYYQTYLHEIGHALGLGHAGNYNGSATYGTSNHYENDSWQASVMSYFHQTQNTSVDASFAYVITPQVADILAIQSLYGTPTTVRTGDDTYGKNATTGTFLDTAMSLSNPVSFTVFDSGGVDRFDFSDFNANQVLDLRETTYSSLGGLTGNIAIARGTIIEYGLTGGGDDFVFGNAADNGLSAGNGADTIVAGAGHDAAAGGGGNDAIWGESGRDLVVGGAGNDVIDGGADGDLLIGDAVTLAELVALFPAWAPPAHAQVLLDQGDLLALWDDILLDVFSIA